MEKILVVMDPVRPHFFAGIHALNLAKRISAKVLFLLVFPASADPAGNLVDRENEATVKKNVQALIQEARSDGLTVDYYTAYGNYENELVSFVQENKVTLLIVESPDGQNDSPEVPKNFLNKLRHRINCRIEVVNKKPNHTERKE
jgi:nucleotide-binding universal stress UspA family protein